MARKYKNDLEREYFRERDRIRKALSRMEDRGIFAKGKIDNKALMPAIPKQITEASVRRLRSTYSTEKLYKKMEYIDKETGEILAVGKNIKRIEREWKAARRAAQGGKIPGVDMRPLKPSDVLDLPKIPKITIATNNLIIENLRNEIGEMRSPIIRYLWGVLNAAENTIGKERLANIIEENASRLHDIVSRGTGKYSPSEIGAIGAEFESVITRNMDGALERSMLRDDEEYLRAAGYFASIDFDDYMDSWDEDEGE